MNLTSEDKERIRGMKPTLRELRIIDLLRDYKALRSRHFGTRVPPVNEISIGLYSKEYLNKMTFGECRAFAAANKLGIGIYSGWLIGLGEHRDDVETRQDLIHEMCHVSVNIKFRKNMWHGEHWKKEMRRLAAAGAYDDNWW